MPRSSSELEQGITLNNFRLLMRIETTGREFRISFKEPYNVRITSTAMLPCMLSGKLSNPVRTCTGPYSSKRLTLIELLHSRHVRLSALSNGRLYSPGDTVTLISFRGWVDPRTILRPEGLSQWKIPMTISGIETATFRLVTQWHIERSTE